MTNRIVQTVRFMSQIAARDCEPHHSTSMISIVGPRSFEAYIKPGFRTLLKLYFDDVDEESLNVAIGSIPDFSDDGALIVNSYLLPDLHHAREIVNFVETGDFEHLAVHCFAGRSRSAAVAQFVTDKYSAELLLQDHIVGTQYKNNRLYRLLHTAFLERHPCSENHFV